MIVGKERRNYDQQNATTTNTPYYDYEYSSVPAGCQFTPTDGGECTVGTPAYSHDKNTGVLITAGHCIDPDEIAYQPSSSRTVGSATNNNEEHTPYFDAGEIDASVPIEFDIASDSPDSYEGWPIQGIKTWDWIKAEEHNNDYGVYKQGRTSGRKSGNIIATAGGGGVSNECKGYFELDASCQGGDSGGPHFILEEEGTNIVSYIIGITASGIDTTFATAMDFIECQYDVTV